MSKNYYLIGAGLFNCVLARLLADQGNMVTVFEKRNHIGGNCFDLVDQNTGIRYHQYGPHIFHYKNRKFFEFISKFGEFESYHHSVKSVFCDKKYPIPINLETINSFYGVNLRPYQVMDFIKTKCDSITNPRNMEEKLLSMIGRDLYEAFFKNYTKKQWETEPCNLPASTIQRIPVRVNYDSSYYAKPYSSIPVKGYTEIMNNMINHENISISLNNDIKLEQLIKLSKSGVCVYTGSLDRLFNSKFGDLPYRSLKFEIEYYNVNDYQGASVINYPEDKYEWTRICEPSHFPHIENRNKHLYKTMIIKEYSKWCKCDDDPYYPINDVNNINLYNKYKNELIKAGNIYPGGRLGMYSYTDMENTIDNAFKLFGELND